MNRFLELVAALRVLWDDHGTKVLGTLATIVASLITIPGLIPEPHLKWWSAANVVLGALTVKRGYTNSAKSQP